MASGSPSETVALYPTARHAVEVHEIPSRSSFTPPVLGLGTIVQLVPSQDSARVWSAGAELSKPPTAMHDVADVQETPVSQLNPAPAGFGVGSIAQVLPFQCSANVTSVPLPFTYSPTAKQETTDGHDTPLRTLDGAPAGSATGGTVHVLPFQRSASAMNAPLAFLSNPTVMQAAGAEQDTPVSQ